MTEIIRHCPDCGWDRPFAQYHGAPGRCPDVPNGYCPEWFCLICGTTVMLGGVLVPLERQPEPVGARARVA
jgi:hypothetical protein